MKPRLRHAMLVALFACLAVAAFDARASQRTGLAQERELPRPAATPKPSPRPAQGGDASADAGAKKGQTSPSGKDATSARERRAQAYAKLLEGQRYLSAALGGLLPPSALRTAQQSFQQAAALDPTLAEPHTALAEIAFLLQDNEGAETSAAAAARINPDNFGAHRILSRVLTIKSNLFSENLDRAQADRAIAELREVVRLDPNDAEGWALLGELYHATGRDKEAVEAFQRWTSSPAPVEARFFERVTRGRELLPDAAFARLGETLLDMGRTTEAVAAIRRALAIQPSNAAYLELLGRTIDASSGSEQQTALAEMRRFVEANPTNTNAVVALARAQARANRFDEAVATLRGALAKGSEAAAPREQFTLRVELAQTLADALRYEEAVAAYEEILKLRGIADAPLTSPNDKRLAGEVFSRIVALRRQAGQTTEALAAIERMRRLLGSDAAEADRLQILLLRQTGKRPEALEVARRARQRHPDAAEFVRLEASLLAETGHVEEGAALLRERIKGQPTDYNEYISLSNLYLDAGRPREAIEAARKALDLAPKDQPELATQALFMLSSAQERAGDTKGSEETLRRILSTQPSNATALNNLGYFLVERNERLNEALDMIRRAVRAEPSNPSFLDSLGWAYFKLGQLDEAERYLSDAARRNPASVAINEHLGDLYKRRGQSEKARTAWEKALSLASEAADTARLKAKINAELRK